MNTYYDGSSASIEINLSYEDGSQVDVASIAYSLFDEKDVALISNVPSSTFVYGDATVLIVIPWTGNQLGIKQTSGSRRLLVSAVTMLGDVVKFNEIYIINGSISLIYMTNSYQTIQEAELNAFNTANVDAFNSASSAEKIVALSDAFKHLGMMTYSIDYNYLGGAIDYITEYNTGASGTSMSQFGRRTVIVDKLNLLPETYISMLPSAFFAKLKIAQVIEANEILSNNDDRSMGMISQKIGESSMSWRQTKPLALPVSRRALESLTGYLHYGSKLGRG